MAAPSDEKVYIILFLGFVLKKRVVMGQNIRQVVASVLILLVFSLPLHSSLVLASLTSVEATGDAGVPGFVAAASDRVHISVALDAPATTDRIKTNYPSDEFFTSCNGTRCFYQSDGEDFVSGIHAYQITLFDAAGIPVDDIDGSLSVDGSAPLINSFSLSGTSYTYAVSDSGCTGCQGCIGLAELTITEGATVISRQNLSGCSATGTVTLATAALSSSEGEVTLCMTVRDRGGLTSEKKCELMDVDTKQPLIGQIHLVDDDGRDISYITGLPRTARAIVNVSEGHIARVTGDFSALNTVNPLGYARMDAVCTIQGDTNQCEWQGIMIDSVEGSVRITLNATDESGNVATASQTLTLIKDTTPPAVVRIYTNPDVDYEMLVLENGENIITAELAGGGSGYAKKNVFIELGELSGTRLRTDGCRLEDSVYRCTFRATITQSDGSAGMVSLTAADDADNSMMVPFVKKTMVDSRAPLVKSVVPSAPCATSGKPFSFDVTVEDTTPVSMLVNVSKISTDNVVYADCSATSSGVFSCNAPINNIVTTYLKDTVELIVEDAAANRVIKNELVEVCEEEGIETPNFFRVMVSPSSPVDRRLLSFMAVPVYVSLSLQSVGSATVVDKSVSCSGAEGAYLMDEGSTNPTLVVKLRQQMLSDNGSDMTISCGMDLMVKKGKKLYSIPEHENLNITIPLRNNPLGDIGTSMQAKIKSADDDINDLKKQIDTWDKYNKMLAMLCTTAELMGTVNSIMQAIKSVYWAVTCTTWTTCMAADATVIGALPGESCAKTAESSWIFGCKGLGSFNYFVEAFVWPTGMIGPNPIGNVVKYSCMLYSCRICDWSTYIKVGIWYGGKKLNSIGVNYRGKQLGNNVVDTNTYSGIQAAAVGITGDAVRSSGLSSAQSSYSSDWNQQASKTDIATKILSDNWIYDPYKSIHYATACLCMPAIIYNMKKERQIKCIYKSCLEKNARMGLSTASCDAAYGEQDCLYVESAQYKLHGYMGGFLESLTDALVASLPGIILGVAYTASCPSYKFDATQKGCNVAYAVGPCGNYERVVCGLSSAAVALAEIYDVISGGLDFSKYDKTLDRADFCSGGAPGAKQ
jgi:hypothetical protein